MSATGQFSSPITGLTPGTLYYVRAYATNAEGMVYGDPISFTTESLALPGEVQFTSATGSVTEGEGSLTITVSRINGSDGAVSVDYDLETGGTAAQGDDFTFASGTLSWEDGETEDKSFTITIVDDAMFEYNETVHLTLENAVGGSIGTPSDCVVTILDNDSSSSFSGWRHIRQDLTASNFYPGPSNMTVIGLNEASSYPLATSTGYILTGNVVGDANLEVVTVQNNTLVVLSSTGDELLRQDIEIAGIPNSWVSMLEDVDGDGHLDIGVAYSRQGGDYGTLYARIYDGTGTLLQEFVNACNGDGRLIPETVIGNQVVMTQAVGYARTPRGISMWDYSAGVENWHYNIGPPPVYVPSITDMDQDGDLDFCLSNATVHNGASSNGTYDGDNYYLIIDETGSNQLTRKYFEGSSDGSILNYFIKLSPSSNAYHLLSLKQYAVNYYNGTSRVHICDLDGNTLHTFTGISNAGWSSAFADIDNDDETEIVVANSNGASHSVTLLDSQLNSVASFVPSSRVIVSAISDFDQDADKEIFVFSSDDDLVQVLDVDLNEKYSFSVPSAETIRGVIVSELDASGIKFILVVTDQTIYFVESDDGSSVNQPPEIVGTIPDQVGNENDPAWAVDLTEYESDPEDSGTALNWSVGTVSGSLFTATITDLDEDILTITPVADASGSEVITLTLTDSGGLTDTQDITVTLNAVNDPPDQPFGESPADGATGVSINADLGWSGSDPENDALTFDVYFGTANPPTTPVATGQSDLTYDPGTLQYSTTYTWRVDAEDVHGASTAGNVWHFTTEAQPNRLPSVTTQAPADITTSTATGHGSITDPGSPLPTAHGSAGTPRDHRPSLTIIRMKGQCMLRLPFQCRSSPP